MTSTVDDPAQRRLVGDVGGANGGVYASAGQVFEEGGRLGGGLAAAGDQRQMAGSLVGQPPCGGGTASPQPAGHQVGAVGVQGGGVGCGTNRAGFVQRGPVGGIGGDHDLAGVPGVLEDLEGFLHPCGRVDGVRQRPVHAALDERHDVGDEAGAAVAVQQYRVEIEADERQAASWTTPHPSTTDTPG